MRRRQEKERKSESEREKSKKKKRQIDQINTITQLAHCFDRDVVYIVEKRNFVPIRHDRYLFDVSVFVFFSSNFVFVFCFVASVCVCFLRHSSVLDELEGYDWVTRRGKQNIFAKKHINSMKNTNKKLFCCHWHKQLITSFPSWSGWIACTFFRSVRAFFHDRHRMDAVSDRGKGLY